MVEKLRPFINGNYVESKTDKYSDIYDPSTGEVIAQAGDGQAGMLIARLHREVLESARRTLPVLENRRFADPQLRD